MQRVSSKLAVGLFVLLMLAFLPPAQSQPAQQGGRGGFRGQSANLLCDILVLNAEKSAKVVAAYEEISTQVREKMGTGQNWQNMSQEERRANFEKMQKEISTQLKEKVKDTLSEKELAAVEPTLSRRIFMPDAELRALRSLDLKDEQREKIQPLTLKLSESMVSMTPGMAQEERDKAQKKYDEAKTVWMGQVSEILTPEQKTAWEAKTKEVQKEIDEMRSRMRNRN